MRGAQGCLSVVLCCILLCTLWGQTALGAVLTPPDTTSAVDTGSGGDTDSANQPSSGLIAVHTAAMEEGASEASSVTEGDEQDFEQLAISEQRKEWLLAIEKARIALKASDEEFKDMADADMKVTDIQEEEQTDSKFKKYQIALRTDSKSCTATVKQESEDKYTVEENEAGNKVECESVNSDEEDAEEDEKSKR